MNLIHSFLLTFLYMHNDIGSKPIMEIPVDVLSSRSKESFAVLALGALL